MVLFSNSRKKKKRFNQIINIIRFMLWFKQPLIENCLEVFRINDTL